MRFSVAMLTVLTLVVLFKPGASSVRDCTYNGKSVKDGEGFNADCNYCLCENGEIGCTARACVPRVLRAANRKDCISSNGTHVKDGEGFFDGCNNCGCKNGTLGCTQMACVSKPETFVVEVNAKKPRS